MTLFVYFLVGLVISLIYNLRKSGKKISNLKRNLADAIESEENYFEMYISENREHVNSLGQIKELKKHASNAAELRLKENKSRDETIAYYSSLSINTLTDLHKYQKAVYYIPELDQIVANEDLIRIGEF